MGTAATIGILISLMSLDGMLIGFLLKNRERVTRTETKIEQLEEEIKEHEESNREKFRDFYAFKDSTVGALADIRALSVNTNQMLKELKDEFKELKK